MSKSLSSNGRHRSLLPFAMAALFLLGPYLMMSCRSAPETNGPERTRRAAPQMPMPSPEELGDNPCGNPRWATLPPEVGQVRDRSGEAIATEEDANDGETPSETTGED